MRKKYLSAPLPFVGQKRKFAKEFRQILTQWNQPQTTIVDLFGGSGLLSHIAKYENPQATVVYNDYDNHRERLANIPQTNALLADLRLIVGKRPKKELIAPEVKKTLLERIREEEERSGYVDYITLSPSLLFSAQYSSNYKAFSHQGSFYNNIKQTDYTAEGYLDGLVIESDDYRNIFCKYKGATKRLCVSNIA